MNKKQLVDVARALDFDWFREHYDELSFDDLKLLYSIWHEIYPDQHFFDAEFFMGCFDKIVIETGRNDLNVVELGGYDGSLALKLLEKHPNMKWLNIEMLPQKKAIGLYRYNYWEYVLSKQIWEECLNIKPCDVFLSSETLEHFSGREVQRILGFITENEAAYLIIQASIKPHPYTWRGEIAAHVLTLTQDNIKIMLRKHYELVFEKNVWKSLWRRRKLADRDLQELGCLRNRSSSEAKAEASGLECGDM